MELLQKYNIDIPVPQQYHREFDVLLYHAIPFFLIYFSLLGLRRHKMSSQESFSHVWYLCNGIIIHLFMDGIVGGYKFCEPLFDVYAELDKRYKETTPIVHFICVIEILFMFPGCVYLSRQYAQTKSVKRELFSIIMSVVQLFGTIFFIGEEVLKNFKDVCDDQGCMTPTPHNLFYFWGIFVGANLIWIFVPMNEIEKATNNIIRLEGNNKK